MQDKDGTQSGQMSDDMESGIDSAADLGETLLSARNKLKDNNNNNSQNRRNSDGTSSDIPDDASRPTDASDVGGENGALTGGDAGHIPSVEDAAAMGMENLAQAGTGEAIKGASEVAGAAASEAAGEAAGQVAAKIGEATGTVVASAGGAEAGAAAGTAVAPVVGTAVGAVVGTLVKPIAKAIVIILVFTIIAVAGLITAVPGMIFSAVSESAGNAIDIIGDRITLFLSGDWNNYEASPLGLQAAIQATTKKSHDAALYKVTEQIIALNLDSQKTLENLIDTSSDHAGNYDACFLVAAYSYATPASEQTTLDLERDLLGMDLYKVTVTVVHEVIYTPVSVPTYTKKNITYTNSSGISVKTAVYVKSGTETITLPGQKRNIYTENVVIDYTDFETPITTTYFTKLNLKEEITLESTTIQYGIPVISANYKNALETMYGIDFTSVFGTDNKGYSYSVYDYVNTQAKNYLLLNGQDVDVSSLFGASNTAYGSQSQTPLTEVEANEILNSLTASDNQKYLIYIALSGVGRIPYYWAGRSEAGWDTTWGTTISASANPDKTDYLKGLDCSGFVEWIYKTAYVSSATTNPAANDSTADMISKFSSSSSFKTVTSSTLQAGDICIRDGHTAIFLKYDSTGAPVYIHEAGHDAGCVISTSSAFTYFYRFIENENGSLTRGYVASFGLSTANVTDGDLANLDYRTTGLDAATFEFFARVVKAEAGDGTGKDGINAPIAVADCIWNRTNSTMFPNTVMGVLTESGQFATVKIVDGQYQAVNGSTTVFANDNSRLSVIKAFQGGLLPDNILYFRADYYFSWATDYACYGDNYFSSP